METSSTQILNHAFLEDFKYRHNNPYHHKLNNNFDFILTDTKAERFKGIWNSSVFKNDFPLHVEIGPGYGHFLSHYCQANPHTNVIGIDFRFKRTYMLAKRLNHIQHKNFTYLRAKAERLEFLFAPSEIEKIFYFFPDPWPKRKHHKKRLFQPNFLKVAHSRLVKNGLFMIKTDHDDYFHWMLEVLGNDPDLFSIELKSFDLYRDYPEHFLASIQTKFEKIFLAKKIPIKALVLRAKKGQHVSR